MPEENIESVHFSLFQEYIVDNGFFDGLYVALLYLLDVVSYDLFEIVS